MQNFEVSRTQSARVFYLAPIDAIWPPLALMVLAVAVGSIGTLFGIKTLMVLAALGMAILIGDIVGARDEEERYEVVRRFRRAWCARVACNAAWKREHQGSELPHDYVSATYHELGYRWWHIFPDLTFTRHSPFIKTAFWVHLFTGKMNRDKYEKIECDMEPAE